MNVWWFLSALLFWIVICNADPANNIQIGFNCIGITTATRIFETVEVIKAIDDNAADKPWYTRMFNSAPKTILTVVKTYPPIRNESCTISCVRVRDLANTAKRIEVVAGGIGDRSVTIRMIAKTNQGLLCNVTVDAYCVTPGGPPSQLPPLGWNQPNVISPAPPNSPVSFNSDKLNPTYPPARPVAPPLPSQLPPALPIGWVLPINNTYPRN